MQKLIFGAIFCLLCLSSYAQEQKKSFHPDPIPIQEISITGNFFALYSYFDIATPNENLGKVIKEKYNLWTHYGYYGKGGDKDLIADTYINLFSLGQLFSWSSVMDINTHSGMYLGTIEGWWLTFASAKFSFYDKQGNTLGIASMDLNKTNFNLLDPYDDHLIARYQRIHNENEPDHWLISVYEETAIPQPLLILFGAFAVDHQDHFNVDGGPEPLEPVKDWR